MATIYFLGTATAVAQESRATPANVGIGDVFNLLVNGEVVATFTATVATVANVTAGLVAAWNLSTNPYATRITASDQSTYVKLLADNAGEPFTVTSSTVDGNATNTQTLTMSTPTASAGPNDWSTAANWSGGAVPVSNDVVIFKDTSVPIVWNIDQSAVVLDSMIIYQSYTGTIGNNRNLLTAADGSSSVTTKPEYRGEYLNISSDILRIGENLSAGDANGANRIKINLGNEPCTVTIFNTALSSDRAGLPAVRLLANDAATDIYVRKAPGGIGIAVDRPGEVSVVNKISIADTSTTSRVFTGEGVTVAEWEQNGGNNIMNAAATIGSVIVNGGNMQVEGDYTITAFTVNGGSVIDNHQKTAGNAITTLNLKGGSIDAQQSTVERTWGTVNITAGTLKADGSILTITTLNDPAAGKYSATYTAG